MVASLSLPKIQKLVRHGNRYLFLATQEAEAGELLEPRKQSLQSAEIVTPYSSLGDRVRFRCKKKKTFVSVAFNVSVMKSLHLPVS